MNDTLYIDGIIYSLQKFGGISSVFNEIIRRLPPNYFKIGLYKNNYFQQDIADTNIIFHENRLLERYRDIENLSNEYKIFHSTYYRLPKNTNNLKIVQTVHDFVYEKYKKGLKRNIHSLQKKRSIYNADKIICVSQNTKNDLLEFYGNQFENKCTVIHNAPSNEFYNFNISNIYNNIVLFIGHREGYKNFISLVKAMVDTKDLFLNIIGGPELNKNEITLLNKYLYGRYKYLGYVSNSKLNILYNNAYCLAYISLYEGFGIPILEAMKCGCPIIAINSSSIREIIPNKDMLINTGELEEITFFLKKLINKQFRLFCIQQGFLISSNFSLDKQYTETLKIYNSF
jgi:mannosyltransferase